MQLSNSSKAHREVCAAGRTVFDPDDGGVCIRDAPDYRKPKPCSSNPPAVAPPKALKDEFPFVLFDSWSLVKDLDQASRSNDDLYCRS